MFKFICFVLISILSFAMPVYSKTVILMLGDSLTEGYGIKKSQAYPNLVTKILKDKGYSIKIINAGISGSTSASALSRFKWHLQIKPDILLLALGANDGLRGLPIEEMKENLAKTIELAESKGVQVLLAGMKIPPNYGLSYTKSFEDCFYELSKKYNVPLIPFLLDGVAGAPSLNQVDGIHPNAKGHVIISKTVSSALIPLLPSL